MLISLCVFNTFTKGQRQLLDMLRIPSFYELRGKQSAKLREVKRDQKFALNLRLSCTVPRPVPNLYRCTPQEQMNKCDYKNSQDVPEPITHLSQSGLVHLLWTWSICVLASKKLFKLLNLYSIRSYGFKKKERNDEMIWQGCHVVLSGRRRQSPVEEAQDLRCPNAQNSIVIRFPSFCAGNALFLGRNVEL